MTSEGRTLSPGNEPLHVYEYRWDDIGWWCPICDFDVKNQDCPGNVAIKEAEDV